MKCDKNIFPTLVVDNHRKQIFGPFPSKKQAKHVSKIVRMVPDHFENVDSKGKNVKLVPSEKKNAYIEKGFKESCFRKIKDVNKKLKTKNTVKVEKKSLFF